jgi:Protein of unknown function (DUF3501)
VKIQRSEILSYEAYELRRDALRARAMEEKRPRRVHVGPVLTFLFENAVTTRYQVQEMVRAEQLRRPEEIQHEVDTYNELLGGPGELGCALLIELTDPRERDEKLRAWKELPAQLYVKLADGQKVRPAYDPRQVGEDRLSSVQYLRFPVGGGTPVAVGCDLAALTVEVALTAEQRAALEADLRATRPA